MLKKRTVGLYARYDASEQTICAVFLARYVATCYRYVRWFTPSDVEGTDRRYRGFSYQWDNHTIAWNSKATSSTRKEQLAPCDTFFFFEPEESIRARLPARTVTAFVLDPRKWSPEVKKFAESCKFTLLPCQSWLDRFPVCRLLDNVHPWPFDPAIQCIPRTSVDFTTSPKVFFTAYGMKPRDLIFVEQVMRLTRKCLPNVQTALGFFDTDRSPDRSVGIDSQAHDWRMIRYLQNADWVVDLNTRPYHCIFPSFAGGYGSQWIGFDVLPNRDEINGARRHLVSQPVVQDEDYLTTRKGPRVTPNVEQTTEQIVYLLQQTFNGELDRNRSVGAWDHRRADYLKTTNAVLGIKTRY